MRLFELIPLLFLCPQAPEQPVTSPHRYGPHGLQGWKLSETVTGVESQGPLPVALVISRNGHTIRRIDGQFFLWRWMFQADGKQVAYETGPLHFGLQCVLVDIRSGRQISKYDCYQMKLHPDAPAWVQSLESYTEPEQVGR